MFAIVLIWSLLVVTSVSQQVFINEVQSSNSRTVADEDGNYPDWLELVNTSLEDISLNGYWLSDDEMEIFKWPIPEITLEPDKYLLIFASDKDKYSFWDSVVNWGDNWKYLVPTTQPSSNWNRLSFNDTNWLSGPSGFGYGDGDDATLVNQTTSLYARIIFSIDRLEDVMGALLHIDYDDAFIAYLNGFEIARANMGDQGWTPSFNATSDEPREATIHQGGRPELFVIEKTGSLFQQGENVLAIQVHNYDLNSSDLTLIPFFTLKLNSMPTMYTSPHQILNLRPISLHTNFKIRSAGEQLLLSDQNGDIIDSLYTGEIPLDVSKGRYPDGESIWLLFPEPTPGFSNNTSGYPSILIADEPEFDPAGGFFSGVTSLKLSADSLVIIYYTLDGSEPDESSEIYINSIKLNETTVVRTRSYYPGLFPSKIASSTYFISEEKTLPVFSLSTDPVNLWSRDLGIYSNNTSRWEWEIPVHVEFFEDDGELGFSIDAGMEIYGWGGSFFDQKSLAIYARGKYGYPELNYQLFPNLDVDVFEAFILRNSGNDWWSVLFRDALTTSLMTGTEVDFQAYRPSVVYLNGKYWGIHNIREKINEHFLASHHDIDPDNIDFLEYKEMPEPLVHHGDSKHYNAMYNFISENDLSEKDNYEYVKTLMDIDNFIDYQIGEIYCANLDWPANNIKFWRPRTSEGKWRWIIYDTDTGFSLWDDIWDDSPTKGWGLDFIAHATEDEQSWGYPEDWPNAPWSTHLLRGLLENESFKNDFINRFADYLNSRFAPDSVKQLIEKYKKGIEEEIPFHVNRWYRTVEDWENEVQKVETFATSRRTYVYNHIVSNFGLKGLARVKINAGPQNGGNVQVNSIVIDKYPWKGDYFRGIPIKITAIPSPGYRFVGWLDFHPAGNRQITISPGKNLSLHAVFQQELEFASSIIFNEINYNAADDFNTEDWIELYNPTEKAIDISGWIFKDSDDSQLFSFPPNTVIPSEDFLVLCRNCDAFTQYFPDVSNYIGEFNFGLSSDGELIRLYDPFLNLIDSLTYGNESPWPTEPDGQGATVELANPLSDNDLPENWVASRNHGTPGNQNGLFSLDLPEKYTLLQNYPNPFNTNTIIEYSIPEANHVTLKVFDLQGREVITLIEKDQPPGTYRLMLDKRDLSSGIYFSYLKAGKFSKSRKMLYVK